MSIWVLLSRFHLLKFYCSKYDSAMKGEVVENWKKKKHSKTGDLQAFSSAFDNTIVYRLYETTKS